MPADIRRDNITFLKKIVLRFISSLLSVVQRKKKYEYWILRLFSPLNFYSTFQNYKQLFYVVVINNSSENLPLRPVKLTLFFLTTDFNCGESAYLKLMQAERGHKATPIPGSPVSCFWLGGSTGDKPVFTGALNELCSIFAWIVVVLWRLVLSQVFLLEGILATLLQKIVSTTHRFCILSKKKRMERDNSLEISLREIHGKLCSTNFSTE